MTSMRPLDADHFGTPQARHLLWRAGFGGTAQQIRQLVSWGLEHAVAQLVNVGADHGSPKPGVNDFSGDIVTPLDTNQRMQLRVARQNQNEESLAQFRARRQKIQRRDRQQIKAMQRWWLTRMIETTRPLEEKMTLFWHGHFATSYRTTENSYHMYMQNQLFREHAAGNIASLLHGIVHDPAMLKYLNNHQNRRQSPNENLARELMELFSLGTGAYREQDIKEGARALTGYTFAGNAYRFNAQSHDAGQKRILGQTGAFDGDGFVNIILNQHACANYVCTKLYRFFVADVPDDSDELHRTDAWNVIQHMARTMRANRYAMAPVLEELFLSEHFFAAQVMGQRIKSPVELVVGAVRSLETPARNLNVLIEAMDMMGQDLFFPPNVAGWPGERAWINTSTLFTRHNILSYLLTGQSSLIRRRGAGSEYDALALIRAVQEGTDDDSAAHAALRFMLISAPREAQVKQIEALYDKAAALTHQQGRAMLTLIAAMPEYQLC